MRIMSLGDGISDFLSDKETRDQYLAAARDIGRTLLKFPNVLVVQKLMIAVAAMAYLLQTSQGGITFWIILCIMIFIGIGHLFRLVTIFRKRADARDRLDAQNSARKLEIQELREKLKSEQMARQKAEDDARKANAHVEHLKRVEKELREDNEKLFEENEHLREKLAQKQEDILSSQKLIHELQEKIAQHNNDIAYYGQRFDECQLIIDHLFAEQVVTEVIESPKTRPIPRSRRWSDDKTEPDT
jgi:regulator of replication initiation timing